jgi:GAF domain-containing protein
MDLVEPLHWPTDRGILARALETGQAIQQEHISQDIALPPQQGRDRSHLAIPVRQADQPAIGVLALESDFADGFTPAQIDSAVRLAEHAVLAIANALHYEQAHRRLDRSLAVHQSSQALTPWLAQHTLPRRIVLGALDALQANRAALYLYDNTAGSWTLVAAQDRDGDQVWDTHPTEHSLVKAAAHNGSARFASDPAAGDSAALPLRTPVLPGAPAQLGRETLGVLYLAFKAGSRTLAESEESLYLYANHAAMALRNAQRVTQLEHAAQQERERANHVAAQSRDPLAAIHGYTDMMLQQIGGEITEQQREFLETIQKNATRLEALLYAQPDP